jgi:hypothetical protein
MKRSMALAAAVVMIGAATAAAGPVSGFFANVLRDYRRNHCWPEPFVSADRMAVRAPLSAQIAIGWQVQNTLEDYHFVDGASGLNEAGQLKVESIMRNTPHDALAIFVLRDPRDPQLTIERVEAVRAFAGPMTVDGSMPAVLVTNREPRGAPAYYIDEVNRRYQATTPDPRLPDTTMDEEDMEQ